MTLEGYTPNFANGQYKKAYMTFLQKLDCDTGNKSISLTPSEWANGYTLYTYKITDGSIGPGTYGPRYESIRGSARLKVLFSAAVNENIKVILLYQMLSKLDFPIFKQIIWGHRPPMHVLFCLLINGLTEIKPLN